MTHSSKYRIAATLTIAIGILPASAMAGTRAGDATIAHTSAKPASANQGPKGGFPNAPGLIIANIKANENAAFKRKSNGT